MRRSAGRAGVWLFIALLGAGSSVAGCGDDAEQGSPGSAGTPGTAGSSAGRGGSVSSAAGERNAAGEPGSSVNGGVGGAGGSGEVTEDAAHDLVIYGCTSAGVMAAVQAT